MCVCVCFALKYHMILLSNTLLSGTVSVLEDALSIYKVFSYIWISDKRQIYLRIGHGLCCLVSTQSWSLGTCFSHSSTERGSCCLHTSQINKIQTHREKKKIWCIANIEADRCVIPDEPSPRTKMWTQRNAVARAILHLTSTIAVSAAAYPTALTLLIQV